VRRVSVAALAAAAGMALPLAARACGACVEDKVAAAYDHAVVSSALARRRVVVFAGLEGPREGAVLAAAARRAAGRVDGIERASVRGAAEPAVVSFVLDPAVRAPESALRAIQQRASPGLRVSLLRVLR
jgi:hypothetical protein